MNGILIPSRHDVAKWNMRVLRRAFREDIEEFRQRRGKEEGEAQFFRDCSPTDVLEVPGNLLVLAGASALLRSLRGDTLTAFSAANSHLGVGDSTTSAADSQTDLQAASNKLRVGMDSTYPTHTNGTASMVWQSTFSSGQANFAWQEWAIFNASTSGTMLNRKVASLGTKTTGSWTLTATLTLS